MTTAYIEVACASNTEPHAYTMAVPMERVPGTQSFMPRVPVYCKTCPPPPSTDETGIAVDRKANVHGGVFIKSWRYTSVDDPNRPVAPPRPVQAEDAA